MRMRKLCWRVRKSNNISYIFFFYFIEKNIEHSISTLNVHVFDYISRLSLYIVLSFHENVSH